MIPAAQRQIQENLEVEAGPDKVWETLSPISETKYKNKRVGHVAQRGKTALTYESPCVQSGRRLEKEGTKPKRPKTPIPPLLKEALTSVFRNSLF